MKKCIVFVPAMFAIVLFVAVPAQASSFDDGLVGVSAQQPLPAFMHGLDAVPMTESEMGEVRGEAAPWLVWLVWQAFKTGLTSTANYIAEHYDLDMRFTLFSPLCVGEDC